MKFRTNCMHSFPDTERRRYPLDVKGVCTFIFVQFGFQQISPNSSSCKIVLDVCADVHPFLFRSARLGDFTSEI